MAIRERTLVLIVTPHVTGVNIKRHSVDKIDNYGMPVGHSVDKPESIGSTVLCYISQNNCRLGESTK
jgi:hypothetical protein